MSQPTDAELSLWDELESFCKAESLPLVSADELFLCVDLSTNQRIWIHDFIKRWEAVMEQENKPQEQVAVTAQPNCFFKFTSDELATIRLLARLASNEAIAAAKRKREAGRGSASVDDMTYADELQNIINKAAMQELALV